MWFGYYNPRANGRKETNLISLIIRSLGLLEGRERIRLALIAALRIFANVFDIAAIIIIGLVATLAAGQEPDSALFDWLPAFTAEDIPLVLVFAAVLFLVKTATSVGLYRWLFGYLAYLEVKYAAQITRSLFLEDPGSFRKTSRAEIEWAILRSTNFAISGVVGQSITLASEAALSISILMTLFVANPVPAFVATAYLAGLILVFQIAVKKRVNKSGNDVSGGSVSIGQRIADAVNAHKELTVLAKMEEYVIRIISSRAQVARGVARQSVTQSLPRLVLEVGLVVGATVVVILLTALEENGIDYAFLGLLIFGFLRIMGSLLPLQSAFISLRFNKPLAESAQQKIAESAGFSDLSRTARTDSVSLLANRPSESAASTKRGISLRVEDVVFFHDSKDAKPTLSGIEFGVSGGEQLAIVGPSGAGKSTLVDLMLGLLVPFSGCITLDGHSSRDFLACYPGHVAYVPQKPGLVSGTIADNIALGIAPKVRDDSLMRQAIYSAGLTSLVDSLPLGPESSLGPHVSALSGGQLQRIGIARALYLKPRLLVLDEATSALDAATEAVIAENLYNLRARTTVVIIAHRLSTIRNADKVAVIEEGRLESFGSYAEIRKSSRVFSHLNEDNDGIGR